MHGGCKIFLCIFCEKPKQFKTKYNRDVHHYKHVGQRPYKCEKCDDSFQQRANVRRHMESRHDVRCAECHTEFKNATELPAHYATEHPHVKLTKPNTNFKCVRWALIVFVLHWRNVKS